MKDLLFLSGLCASLYAGWEIGWMSLPIYVGQAAMLGAVVMAQRAKHDQ